MENVKSIEPRATIEREPQFIKSMEEARHSLEFLTEEQLLEIWGGGVLDSFGKMLGTAGKGVASMSKAALPAAMAVTAGVSSVANVVHIAHTQQQKVDLPPATPMSFP